MFKCPVTNKLVGPGVRAHRVVLETRTRMYTCWDRNTREEYQTEGTEIVREVLVSEEGRNEILASIAATNLIK